ncbi:MAG: cytochrome c oxidase subunit 3 [Planctomycetota bacterium]|jgi:cytochrome c oxidase subunit 3|nr:cytochrome c oxidase subunit 3 [Planctomycetota bacterium]MDP6762732.1 cytochrome c oxidase subunit 3 [Planctomycetota bacterium]MDP6988542.1 cytochrome c oxidase subunit 3 [Planctomycetota bacterium]
MVLPRSHVPVLFASGSGVLAPPRRDSDVVRRRLIDEVGPPPDRWDGGGGGGGGGGDDDERPEEPTPRPSGAGELAFGILLAAVCTLFVVFLLAYGLARRNAPDWPPPGTPPIPEGLWVSTLLLLATSAALARASRRTDRRRLREDLCWSALSGGAFLLAQAWAWRELLSKGLSTADSAFGAVFYSLTGLHAAHVAGGLAALFWLIVRLRGQEPTMSSPPSLGVRLCALYWHTMGVIWIAIFGLLLF